MTDRELLELAAKAAGINARFDPHGQLRNCTEAHPAMNMFAMPLWSPLTDDGDALRLAVGLSLDVTHWGGSVNVNKPGKGWVHAVEHWGPIGDQLAATRRAIVRAAAEIGKAMR